METGNTMNRREWLFKGLLYGTLGATFTTLGGILFDVWIAAGRFSSARWTEVASAAEFTQDIVVPFPEKKMAIIRKAHRLGAISLECPHLGCLVNTLEQGFFCPCHGSEFGPLGEVYTGPARDPLMWHALYIRDGRIWIHSGKKRQQPYWIQA
jgi:nitrite reductase/ring-hydroxylating ferredoxin subunit